MVVLSPDERAQNIEEQDNETELLVSMFDKNVTTEEGVVTINIKSDHFLLVLRCLYHELYPSREAPIFTIIDMTNTSHASHVIDDIQLELECSKLFTRGECVVYQWVGYISEYLESLDLFVAENSLSPELSPEDTENDKIIADIENLQLLEDEFNAKEAEVQVVTETNSSDPYPSLNIYTGTILTERKSHFQAHVCQVFSKKDVSNTMTALLRNPKIAGATHNIMAYRYTNKSGTLAQDYDDDGETKAGGRLLELIDLMDVENLMVVVTRWYGGVHLGPSRFKCINNIAKKTIVESGFYDIGADSSKKKKRKK